MSEFDVLPAQDLVRGLRRLELAHVEPDHALDRAEQILGDALGKLRLAGAGGAREQEHADRLVGVVEARLQHGDAVDDRRHRLVLADDAAREVGADRGEVDALVAVEDGDGQARELGQRHDHLLRREPALVALEDAGCGQLDEVHHRAWEARGAEILARRADGDRHAAGVDLETCLLRKARHERVGEVGCLLLALRLEPHDLHEPAQQRPRLHEAGRARRRRLGPHDQAAGGDGGQDLVEDARGLALVRAAAGELQHVGDVPDQLLGGGKLGDGLLDAGLELAEPLLARHQVGAAGFEHLPARLLETVGKQTQERGLAHAVLAADQHRARRRLPRHRLGRLQHLLPHLGLDQQLALLAVPPEAAEGAEEGAVDAGALVAVELLGQLRRERMMDALQEGLDGGMRRGIAGIEGGAEGGKVAQALALGEVVAKKAGHDQVLAPPVLGRHHGRADRRRHVHGRQVAKREVDRPGIDLVEVGDDVVGDLAAVGAACAGRPARRRPAASWRRARIASPSPATRSGFRADRRPRRTPCGPRARAGAHSSRRAGRTRPPAHAGAG